MKRMSKKIISILCVAAMILSMGVVSAFAADKTVGGGDTDIPGSGVITPATVTVNKTALNNKIAEVETALVGKTVNDYTTASWNALQTALTGAKGVSANATATQTEVDNALAALTTAFNGLAQRPVAAEVPTAFLWTSTQANAADTSAPITSVAHMVKNTTTESTIVVSFESFTKTGTAINATLSLSVNGTVKVANLLGTTTKTALGTLTAGQTLNFTFGGTYNGPFGTSTTTIGDQTLVLNFALAS